MKGKQLSFTCYHLDFTENLFLTTLIWNLTKKYVFVYQVGALQSGGGVLESWGMGKWSRSKNYIPDNFPSPFSHIWPWPTSDLLASVNSPNKDVKLA